MSRDDVRLVGDIEKLIKKKIEIEPFELDAERPPRFERPGRMAAESDVDDAPVARREPGRTAYTGRSAVVASTDPFFDRPYESAASATTPAWERGATMPVARGISPNIKPKKRVAALFGGQHAD